MGLGTDAGQCCVPCPFWSWSVVFGGALYCSRARHSDLWLSALRLSLLLFTRRPFETRLPQSRPAMQRLWTIRCTRLPSVATWPSCWSACRTASPSTPWTRQVRRSMAPCCLFPHHTVSSLKPMLDLPGGIHTTALGCARRSHRLR